jgi:hypothetical protein
MLFQNMINTMKDDFQYYSGVYFVTPIARTLTNGSIGKDVAWEDSKLSVGF